MFLLTLLLNCKKKKIVYNICTVASLYHFKALPYLKCTVLLIHHLFQFRLNLFFTYLCTQIKVVHQLCQPTYQWGTVDTHLKDLLIFWDQYLSFLAHLAKGNVSFCHHLASVVS